MTDTLAGRPGRGGITINDKGDQGVVGFWPEHLDNSPTGWTGQLRNQFGEAVRIAQRYHLQNEMIRTAKATNKQAVLPEPSVRQSLARAEQRKLAEVERHVSKIADEAFSKRSALKPFEYADTISGVAHRQELRTTLRGMNDKDRQAALKKHSYRAAALELEPEQVGMQKSHFDLLMEAEVAAKFPDVVAGTAEAFEAAEIVALAIKTTRKAIENELVSSGGAIAEPAATPAPAKAWA